MSAPFLPGCPPNRLDDAQMAAAPAQVVHQGLLDVGFLRMGIAVEQRLRRHDHAIGAVAALRRLLVEKGLLQRVKRCRRGQTLERGYLRTFGARDWSHARARGGTVNDARASAALAQAAAKLRPA